LPRRARDVAAGIATKAGFLMQVIFRLGQLFGIVRLATMTPERRRSSIRLAEPRVGRKGQAA